MTENSKTEEKKGTSILRIVGGVFIAIIAIFILLVIGPCITNIPASMAQKKLADCEANLKTLAEAISDYADDHEGKYPSSLDELIKNKDGSKSYIDEIPKCPSCEKTYIYKNLSTEEKNDYEITCGGENAHKDTGNGPFGVGKGYYPKYTPDTGITLK